MALTPLQRLQNIEAPRQFESDVTSERISTEQSNVTSALEAIKRANAQRELEPPQQTVGGTMKAPSYDFSTQVAGESAQMGNVPRVTQAFGNHSSIEAFSKGINLGTDFGVKRGTPLALPPGEWEVMKTFTGAKEGQRSANSGSGNLVKVINTKTGEMLAFEHLSGVGVRPGQRLNGGTVIGLSGNTGNSTGDHASIPYQDASGKYHDILNSPYAQYIFGKGGGSTTGKGGGMSGIGDKAMEYLSGLFRNIPSLEQQKQQLASLTPEQIQEQSMQLAVGMVSPLESSMAREMAMTAPLARKTMIDVLPEFQKAITKSLNRYRMTLKPWGGPMEEVMTNSLNRRRLDIPQLLKNGTSKYTK